MSDILRKYALVMHFDSCAGFSYDRQRKYAEVMDGLDRAEALWMTALENLEKAQA